MITLVGDVWSGGGARPQIVAGKPMLTLRRRVTSVVALLLTMVVPACGAETDGFRDGGELLAATGVCEGPIESSEPDSWSCPSGRSNALHDHPIVVEVHDDPAAMRASVQEMLEFSRLLGNVVMGEGWYVYGLSSHQASRVVESVGGRVISRGAPRGEAPQVVRAV